MLRKVVLGTAGAIAIAAVWIPISVAGMCNRRNLRMWNLYNIWDKREMESFLDYLQTSEWQTRHPYRTYFNVRWHKPPDGVSGSTHLSRRFFNAAEPIVYRPERRPPVAFEPIPMEPVDLTYWNDSFGDATFHNLTVMNNLRALPADEYKNVLESMLDVDE